MFVSKYATTKQLDDLLKLTSSADKLDEYLEVLESYLQFDNEEFPPRIWSLKDVKMPMKTYNYIIRSL